MAAKTLSATILDLLTQPDLLAQVRDEWKEMTRSKSFKSYLPADAKPPVVPDARR